MIFTVIVFIVSPVLGSILPQFTFSFLSWQKTKANDRQSSKDPVWALDGCFEYCSFTPALSPSLLLSPLQIASTLCCSLSLHILCLYLCFHANVAMEKVALGSCVSLFLALICRPLIGQTCSTSVEGWGLGSVCLLNQELKLHTSLQLLSYVVSEKHHNYQHMRTTLSLSNQLFTNLLWHETAVSCLKKLMIQWALQGYRRRMTLCSGRKQEQELLWLLP